MRFNAIVATSILSAAVITASIPNIEEVGNNFLARESSGQGQTIPNAPKITELTRVDGLGSLVVNETRNAQAQVEHFFRRLRSFFFRGTFNFIGLEYEIEDINQELLRVSLAVEKILPNAEIFAQLEFVKSMCKQMRTSIKLLRESNLSKLPGHRWVFRIIELNVMLLEMNNSHGKLDLHVKLHDQKLFGFWRNVHIWQQRFRRLHGVPDAMHVFYEMQSFEAEKTLATLASQLPGEYPSLF